MLTALPPRAPTPRKAAGRRLSRRCRMCLCWLGSYRFGRGRGLFRRWLVLVRLSMRGSLRRWLCALGSRRLSRLRVWRCRSRMLWIGCCSRFWRICWQTRCRMCVSWRRGLPGTVRRTHRLCAKGCLGCRGSSRRCFWRGRPW